MDRPANSLNTRNSPLIKYGLSANNKQSLLNSNINSRYSFKNLLTSNNSLLKKSSSSGSFVDSKFSINNKNELNNSKHSNLNNNQNGKLNPNLKLSFKDN